MTAAPRPPEQARPMVGPASPTDRSAVEALLKAAALPLDGLDDAWARLLVARDDQGAVVGAAGLERHDDVGLLRSVVVAPRWRGRGVAGALCAQVIARARGEGIGAIHLLTTTAEAWFAARGFRALPRSDLPAALAGSAELTGACPASAVAMVLESGTP
ncbi:MAG: arsenic resistance N-acetyltransferase ArsN2 [Gemmatimonadota bacterium]